MEEDKAVDPTIEVEAPVEESPTEAPTEEAPEEEVIEDEPQPEPEADPEPEPEPEKPSRRENLRIQQIIERARQGEYTPKPEAPAALDYGRELDADPETIKALEADRQRFADSQRSDVLKQVEAVQFRTALEIDAPKVEGKYPQLDKDSEQFNKPVADAVNQWYLSMVGWNPQTHTVANSNVRYSDFVEGVMELANEMAGEKVATTTRNIAKQVATTALRPDGSSAKSMNLSKDPGSMTKEELDAKIKHDLRTLKTIR